MHFLDDRDLNRAQQLDLLDTTWKLKHEGLDLGTPLAGKTLAMVMSKPSLRTRTSFTVATRRLGGHILEIGAHNTKLGKGEDMEEWAAVLTRMVDAIGARVHGHEDLEALAKFGSKPVVNLLSDKLHPLQSLCDAFTVYEREKARPAGHNERRAILRGAAQVGLPGRRQQHHPLHDAGGGEPGRDHPRRGPGREPDAALVEDARACTPPGPTACAWTRTPGEPPATPT